MLKYKDETIGIGHVDLSDINEEISQKELEITELKMLGWTVPSECPIQNYTDANGVFHQRVGRVDLGSLTWTLFKAESNIFSTSITGIQNTKYALMYSNIYNLANDKSVSEFANMDMRSSGNSAVVFIRNTSYSDADTFKSAMSGVYLYYELATEVTKSVDGNEKLANKSITNFNVVSDNVKSGHKINVYKTGNIVFVNFDFKTEIDITAWTNKYFVTNMPKPLHSIYFMDASDHKFNINTNGVFQLANGTASADTELYGCITYFSVE